ncbi:protein AAR2 homolog [Tachyglossus aculeatus]|uniref:protein AAR2 homolog n=1 Tax=Tachyglossus aculeatus TaxID=9261 RepID=UPI0018F2D4A2|nr:protein AAR2 homolog [Tachyglossus aculeatus]
MAGGSGRAAAPMEPEVAKRLFLEGATLVILDVPEGTEFGIDYESWRVGPRFRGVKMIPPGVHYVHCSAAEPSQAGPRTGLFLSLAPRGLVMLRWDKDQERLERPSTPQAQLDALRAGLPRLDAHLGPYPHATLKKWVALTSLLSQAQVEQLQPLSGHICSFPEVLPVLPLASTQDRARHNLPPWGTECKTYQEGLARLPQMRVRAGTEIRFSPLPRRLYPEGASPAEVTRHMLDLSYALEAVLSRRYPADPQGLLAELQFAFVCFLIGNVYDAFEHWKQLLNLLCRAEDAMTKFPDLYSSLISVLYHQLNEIPADFFVDIVSQDNFLTSTLQVFFSYICSPTVDRALKRKAEKFKGHLTKKFKWDFEEEPEDCAPVVVELPEGVVPE